MQPALRVYLGGGARLSEIMKHEGARAGYLALADSHDALAREPCWVCHMTRQVIVLAYDGYFLTNSSPKLRAFCLIDAT